MGGDHGAGCDMMPRHAWLPTATCMVAGVDAKVDPELAGTIRRPGGDCLSRLGGGRRRCLSTTAMTLTPAVGSVENIKLAQIGTESPFSKSTFPNSTFVGVFFG